MGYWPLGRRGLAHKRLVNWKWLCQEATVRLIQRLAMHFRGENRHAIVTIWPCST
jgi:hypothetical protein